LSETSPNVQPGSVRGQGCRIVVVGASTYGVRVWFLWLAVGVPCEDTTVKGKGRRLAVAFGAPVKIYVGAVAL